MGAAVATVISNILWLIFCVFFTKRKLKFGFSLKGLIHFIKPAIASIVMGVVVYFYLSSVNNSGLAVVGVIIGMIVYVLVLYLVRGIGKEDTDTIRSMLRLKRPDKA